MFKKLSLIGATLAMGAATLVPAAPAMAAPGYNDGYQSVRYHRGDRYDRYDRYDRGYRGDRSYRGDRYYRDGRYYRGSDRYYRCRRDGTAGTIIGAIAGGLLGDAVVGRRGDETAGAIIGAGVGALAGRAIDKSDSRCRR